MASSKMTISGIGDNLKKFSRLANRWWFRTMAIGITAIILGGIFGIYMPSRLNVKTDNGFVSICLATTKLPDTQIPIRTQAISVTSLGTNSGDDVYNLIINLTDGISDGDILIVGYAGDYDSFAEYLFHSVENYDSFSTDSTANNSGNVVCNILSVKSSSTTDWDGTYPYIRISITYQGAEAITAYKVTGLADSPLDASNSNTGTDAPYNTGSSGYLTQDDELCIAVIGIEEQTDNLGSWTTGTGYVSGNEQSDGSTSGGAKGISIASAARVVTDGTSQAYEGDMNYDNPDWAACIATYKMAAGGTPAIVVSPTSYDFGIVTANTTANTTTTYFSITNTSDIQTDQTIAVTSDNWTGGNGWTHSDTATPGADIVGLKANRGGTWGSGDIIIKYSSPNYIYENCPALEDYSFGLKMWVPTIFSDGDEKTNVVQITAAAG